MNGNKKDRSQGPAYLRLYERLRQEIIDGSYPFGSRMPSKRQLAEEAGVSVVTAEHAYALLCDYWGTDFVEEIQNDLSL